MLMTQPCITVAHKIICFNNTCIYAECDVDGVMLIQLVEEQNAADLKELCPILKYRLQLRSWVKMASPQLTAPSPQHCEILGTSDSAGSSHEVNMHDDMEKVYNTA